MELIKMTLKYLCNKWVWSIIWVLYNILLLYIMKVLKTNAELVIRKIKILFYRYI